MSNRKILLTGIVSIAIVGMVILIAKKNVSSKKAVELDRIADAGYETAGDILYPMKKASKKRRNIA